MSVRPLGEGDAFVSWGKDSAPASHDPASPRPLLRRRLLPFVVGGLGVGVAIVLLVSGGSAGSRNGVAGMQPAAIVAAARHALGSVYAIRVSGAGEQSGQQVGLNLELVTGEGARGTISEHGATFQIVAVDGALYMNGPTVAWQRAGAGGAARLFAGKWLEVASGQFSSMAKLTEGPSLFGSLVPLNGTLIKGPTGTIDGQPVVEVRVPANGDTFYVATTGQPYPVEIVETGAQGGTIHLDPTSQPTEITAPPGAVNISRLDGQN